MSEKFGRLSRALSSLDVALHEIKTLSGSKVPPDNFMHNEKKEMTSSATLSERLQYFSLRLKYNCLHKRASFSCVTLEIFLFYYVVGKQKIKQW